MDNSTSNPKNNKLAQWLDQLQEQSWNLELIISGFALFGLFQLRDVLIVKMHHLSANDFALSNSFNNSFFLFQASVDIFIFSLIVLVFTRGLWIGAIGLRYISDDIDFDHFKYNDKFKKFLLKKVGSFDDYIHKLEHLSSSIFAFTYLLFFIFFSITIYEIAANFQDRFLSKFGTIGENVGSLVKDGMLIFGLLVAFDFLTFGLLKRIKWRFFSTVYLFIYRFVGILTLSFLWRPIWFNFIDQRSTKWVAASAVPFLIGFIAFEFTPFQNFGYKYYPKLKYKVEQGRFSSIYYKENARTSLQSEFYDDQREIEQEKGNYEAIEVMSLPTYKIEVPLLEVFVKYTQFVEAYIARQDSTILPINKVGFNSLENFNIFNFDLIKKTKSEYDLAYEQRQEIYQQQFDSLWSLDQAQAIRFQIEFQGTEQQAYRKYLDNLKSIIKQSFSFEVNEQGIPAETMSLNFHTHSNLGEKGFICTFPLDSVHLGTNELTLKRKFYDSRLEGYFERDFSVPFLYVGSEKLQTTDPRIAKPSGGI